jgi:hypothetical protein
MVTISTELILEIPFLELPMAKKAAAKKPSAPQAPAKAKPSTKNSAGTAGNPWPLLTPPGSSEFLAYRDPDATPPALVVQVGKTELRYQLRCIEDLHAMLQAHGDWMLLGSTDEQKEAPAETVEAWGRSEGNPVGGWYGLKKGLRGRFGMYVPPVLEILGLAEVEHNPRNNRMRAIG